MKRSGFESCVVQGAQAQSVQKLRYCASLSARYFVTDPSNSGYLSLTSCSTKMAKRRHASHNCKEKSVDLSEFEQSRLRRIQQNRQVLADMGLDNAAEQLAATVRHKKRQTAREHRTHKAQEHSASEPTRRSRRLAQEPAVAVEHIELLDTSHSRQACSSKKARQPSSSTSLEQLCPSAHHNHNLHRIRTMSDKALITRAWKITNISKLKSFIEVLGAAGDLEVVLQEAKAALADLTGQAGD